MQGVARPSSSAIKEHSTWESEYILHAGNRPGLGVGIVVVKGVAGKLVHLFINNTRMNMKTIDELTDSLTYLPVRGPEGPIPATCIRHRAGVITLATQEDKDKAP